MFHRNSILEHDGRVCFYNQKRAPRLGVHAHGLFFQALRIANILMKIYFESVTSKLCQSSTSRLSTTLRPGVPVDTSTPTYRAINTNLNFNAFPTCNCVLTSIKHKLLNIFMSVWIIYGGRVFFFYKKISKGIINIIRYTFLAVIRQYRCDLLYTYTLYILHSRTYRRFKNLIFSKKSSHLDANDLF